MSRWAPSWSTGLKALALVAALGFVFSVQYVPHLATFEDPPPGDEPGLLQLGQAMGNHLRGFRDGYPWAIHVDEHYHASVVSRVQSLDRLIPWEPYEPEPGSFSPLGSLRGGVHERGYHVFMAQIGDLTGVDTQNLYQFGPALWMVAIAFGVYALVRPHPAAIPAAAFAGLVPTTVRFLGTGFLVPIGVSLAWLPAAAILSRPAQRRAGSALLLLAVVVWAFFVHLMAGAAAVGLVLGAGLLATGRARRAALTLVGVSLVPVAWLWRSFSGGVQAQIQREQFLPVDLTIFDNFGVITMGIWALGVALYWLDPPGDEPRPEVAAFSMASLVAFGLIVSSLYFELNRYATYTRMHPIYFLTASVPVGYALAVAGRRTGDLARAGLSRLSSPPAPTRRRALLGAGVAVAVVLAGAAPAASQAVSFHLEEPYYRIMGPGAWETYEAIDANVSEDGPYDVFLSHPWQSPFLVEMTGMVPHAIGRPGGPPANGGDWAAYLEGRDALAFYVENDVTVVTGAREPPGDVWTSAGPRAWVMERPYAEQIHRIRNDQPLQLDALPDENGG